MQKEGRYSMKKDYSIIALVGILIWVGAAFLRFLPMPQSGPVRFLLNVGPNFGVVWGLVGLTISFWPQWRKSEFPPKYFYALVGIALALLLASEIVHALFLNSPFDIWDMVTSLISAALLMLLHIRVQRKAAQ